MILTRSGKEVPAEELTQEQLQRAYNEATRKLWRHHKAMCVLDEVIEYIEKEAESRKLVLKEPDTDFAKNQAALKRNSGD